MHGSRVCHMLLVALLIWCQLHCLRRCRMPGCVGCGWGCSAKWQCGDTDPSGWQAERRYLAPDGHEFLTKLHRSCSGTWPTASQEYLRSSCRRSLVRSVTDGSN